MDQFDEIIQRIIADQNHFKEMQSQLFDSFQIMLDNQNIKAINEREVIKNQSTIIKNQQIIVDNQVNIINNQKFIVSNQIILSALMQMQSEILHHLRTIKGSTETLSETRSGIEDLIEKMKNDERYVKIYDPNKID